MFLVCNNEFSLRIMFGEIELSTFEFSKLQKQKIKDWKNTYRCFGTPNGFEVETEEECSKKLGTWDRPCKNDYECPFYKKNKNQ